MEKYIPLSGMLSNFFVLAILFVIFCIFVAFIYNLFKGIKDGSNIGIDENTVFDIKEDINTLDKIYKDKKKQFKYELTLAKRGENLYIGDNDVTDKKKEYIEIVDMNIYDLERTYSLLRQHLNRREVIVDEHLNSNFSYREKGTKIYLVGGIDQFGNILKTKEYNRIRKEFDNIGSEENREIDLKLLESNLIIEPIFIDKKSLAKAGLSDFTYVPKKTKNI